MNLGAKLQVLGHDVEDGWRGKEAEALEEQVRALGALVAHLNDAEQLFETRGDQNALVETRSYLGLVRERSTTIMHQARELRQR